MKYVIDRVLNSMDVKAAIFDLDGTIIDNNAFHLRAWKQYLQKIGRNISEEEYKAQLNGRTNKDVIEYIYGRKMSEDEALQYTLEKEAIYREMYQPFITPIAALVELLQVLEDRKIPMGIATSGIPVNIEFMFSNISIKKYFKVVANSTHITKGKPDPEIYIKTASMLNVPAENCLVFEDAVVGIKSAKAAGMKVIAVATSHSKKELSDADMIIDDYRELF